MKKISPFLNLTNRFFNTLSNERIKASFICASEYKEQFSKARALLPISVGIQLQDREKFKATMELVDKNFSSCAIIIDDTIQRFTMSIYHPRKSSIELYMDSLAEGEQWLSRNKYVFDSLTIPYRIIRWSYWLHHIEFQNALDKVKETYKNNATFQVSFQTSIQEFLARISKRIKFDEKKAIAACTQYLFEECAAITLWPELRCHFEIYPSGRSAILQSNYDLLIKPKYPDLLKSVSVRFNKKNVDHIIKSADSNNNESSSEEKANKKLNLYLGFQ